MPKAKKSRLLTCRRCLHYWRPQGNQRLEFPTPDKLDDHLKSEHESAMHECNAIGCFKGASKTKFQKSETLTQHIKESHGPNTMFSCPIEACTFPPTGLDNTAIHIHWAHFKDPTRLRHGYRDSLKDWTDSRPDRWSPHSGDVDASTPQIGSKDASAVRAIMYAAPWMYLICPVWNCRKIVSGGYDKVSAHLLVHSVDQLDQTRERLAGYGYEVQHPLVTNINQTLASEISINLRCPACRVQCEDDECFRTHVESDHILAPGMFEHLQTWRNDIEPFTFPHPCWLSMHDVQISKFDSIKCSFPTCSYSMESHGDQHPGLLRASDDVKADLAPHRAVLLRHYPELLTHRLFQELLPSGP